MTQNLLIGLDSDFSPVEQLLDIKSFSVLQNVLNGEKITDIFSDDTAVYMITSGHSVYKFEELTGEALQLHMENAKPRQTLRVLMHRNDAYVSTISAMYPYADVSIEVYDAPAADFANYISTALLSGSADWDVISVTSPYLPVHHYIDEGYVYALDEYISSLPAEEWYTDIFDFCRYNSHYYIFPVGVTPDVLIRNDGEEAGESGDFAAFLSECSRLSDEQKVPVADNRFHVRITVPLKPLVAALENNWNGDLDLLLRDVFSLNKALGDDRFYGAKGGYSYMLSAGPSELNQAGTSARTTPVYQNQGMFLGGSAVVQLGFAVLETSQEKSIAQDYLAFLSKTMTSSVSPYKNAFVYENPAVIEQLLSSVSGTQLYTDELASQIIEINSKYLDGSLTLDEAVQSAKDKIWLALGETVAKK